jgi:hypothetical protein
VSPSTLAASRAARSSVRRTGTPSIEQSISEGGAKVGRPFRLPPDGLRDVQHPEDLQEHQVVDFGEVDQRPCVGDRG